MAIDVLTVGTCLVELTPGGAGITPAEAPVLTMLATGAAALFACAAARLGASPALISAVGEDDLGTFVLQELGRMGVDTTHILRAPRQLTSLSFAWADGRGGKSFLFYRFPGFSDPLETLDSRDTPEEALRSARLFDFTESCLRTPGRLRESVLDLARRSRRLGLEVCYAPNWRPTLWPDQEEARRVQEQAVKLSDLLVLNQEEATVISGASNPRHALVALARMGPQAVAITAGGDAPTLVLQEGRIHEVHPFPVEVHYDVGAGDTFHAGFVTAHLRGAGPVEAAHFAAAAAAVKITRPAGLETLPQRQEVEALLAQHRPAAGRRSTPQPG